MSHKYRRAVRGVALCFHSDNDLLNSFCEYVVFFFLAQSGVFCSVISSVKSGNASYLNRLSVLCCVSVHARFCNYAYPSIALKRNLESVELLGAVVIWSSSHYDNRRNLAKASESLYCELALL